MSPTRALSRGAVLVLVAGTAACGVSSVAPKIELRTAVVGVSEADSLSFTLSVPSSPSDVRTFLAAVDEESASVDDATLEELLSTEVVFAYDDGQSAKDLDDDAVSLQVRYAGEDDIAMRVVDEVMYFRVDVPGLSERFSGSDDGLDEVRAQLDAAGLGAAQEAAEALIDGEWVSVDYGDGSWLAELGASMQGQAPALPEDLPQRLLDLAERAFESSVTVTRAGSDDTGDRLDASVNLRQAYGNVSSDLEDLLGDVLGEMMPGLEDSLPPADEVPDRDVTASFWVTDGELRRVELDLAQFLAEPAGSLVLRADMSRDSSIEAPEDSVEIDVEALAEASGVTPEELLGGAFPGPTSVDAAGVQDVATAVGYEFQAYAEYEGVPPTVDHLPVIAEYFAGEPPIELQAVGGSVQVTYEGEVACLTLAADYVSESTVVPGPC